MSTSKIFETRSISTPLNGFYSQITRLMNSALLLKKKTILTYGVILASLFSSSAHAQAESALNNLPAEILETVIYSLIGILMGVVGFKVVDWLTPGDLAEEVAHKENRALAILAGSMMLGVCIIIASALVD